MSQQDIRSLTGIRGIAATMVMLYHFNIKNLFSGAGATILGHGYLMVDLFLILSGFILTLTYGQRFEESVSWNVYANFLLRRVARVFPLFFLMTISAGILISTGWMDHWPGPPISVSALINFTMLQSIFHVPSLDTPGWSVSAEWVVNLLFPFLMVLFISRSWWRVALIAMISFVTLPIIVHIPALMHEPKRAGLLDIWNYETVYPVVRCLADFILGMVLFRLWQYAWVKQLISHDWIAPILFIALLILMSIKQADIWIVGLFFLLILFLIPNNNIISQFLGSKIIYRLGEISYSIYLIHNQMNYFMLALARYLIHLGVEVEMSNGLSMFLFAMLVLVLAELAYRFIEKPARRAINSWVIKRPAVVCAAGQKS